MTKHTSRGGKLKVTFTRPVSDSKQRGKWGHNQQVLPFTYMKAQRESGQRFKSATSKPRRGRAFFHVNEPIDQKPDASIWTSMYTQWAPRGESYTMIVLRVRGHRCHVCQVLPHQSQPLCCPCSPQLAIKKSSETLRSQRCNIGNCCCQAVFNSLFFIQTKYGNPQLWTCSQWLWKRDMTRPPFPPSLACLHMDF